MGGTAEIKKMFAEIHHFIWLQWEWRVYSVSKTFFLIFLEKKNEKIFFCLKYSSSNIHMAMSKFTRCSSYL